MKAEGGKGVRTVSPARRAAFHVLRRVEEEGAYAAVLLAADDDGLSAEDRALCYELVLGTLRWQLWLDRLILHYARRKAETLDAPVRRALRLGLYQLRFLSRIPARAVVNEAVNLAYLSRLKSAAPFINAVLRRAAREENYDPAAAVTNEVEKLAVETSHPVWLIERWTKAFGKEETEGFASANNEAPPVAFRVVEKRGSASRVLDELRAEGGVLEPSSIAPDAWRIRGAARTLQKLSREGMIYLQDEASQLVAHVVGARAGDRVLDVCAAPGSKATHMAAIAPELSLLVAGDLYRHRARTVAESAARFGMTRLRVVVHDAEAGLPFADNSFERVLVDAPCTGTGTLRRNPEIRWRLAEQDIFDLSARQRRILNEASKVLRRGGRLIYSTCSVEPEEDEEVVSHFLSQNADFKLIPADVAERFRQPDGTARVWPHRDGADGFFIALMERQG